MRRTALFLIVGPFEGALRLGLGSDLSAGGGEIPSVGSFQFCSSPSSLAASGSIDRLSAGM
ncbi:MAG: hypothetical protein H0T75_08815 [Rhizobiales bacterium]|nr:hypothetical protein [Hyphomicrobiales bacterium]